MAKYLDIETGEIHIEPEFVKLYIRELCQVKGLSAVQHEIFHFMLQQMDTNNLVAYGKTAKEAFLESASIKNTTFNNNVKALLDAELIQRVSRGEYRVNKKYAVRVDWSRVQAIEWKKTYTADGKTEEVITVAEKPKS